MEQDRACIVSQSSTSQTSRIFATGFAVFISMLMLSSCSRSPAGNIESVLNQCADVSQKASAQNADAATKAGFVADHFQAINATRCPPDFRLAYQQHINAWRSAQMAYANNTVAANVVEGFVAGVTENYGRVGAVQGSADVATQGIAETYYRLTAIAAGYGARIPTSIVK